MLHNKHLKKILLISIVFLITACTEKDKSVPFAQRGGEVKIALNSTIEDIFPFTTDEFNVEQIHKYMLSPSLVSFDANCEAQPDLADGWSIDEDNKTVTYILNSKMKWSNGRPVRAKDIYFTYNFLKVHGDTLYNSGNIDLIKSLEIIDSLTCRFTFNNPVFDPINFTNFSILPLELDSLSENLSRLRNHYKNNFIGCGPFILNSFSTDSLVLNNNNHYPYKYPFMSKAIFKFIKNQEQLENLLNSQLLDVIVNLPLDFAVNKKYMESYNVLTYPERGYTFIGWNLKNPILKNRQIRLALTYAIDKQTIVDGILGGYGTIVNGPVYQNKKSKKTHLPNFSFNPARADSLLNSLGWISSGQDGIRRKYQTRLAFTLMVNKENKQRVDAAINIKSNLMAVGVDLKLELVSWNQILENIHQKNFDAILLTWTDSDNYNPSQLFHSSSIKNGLNFMSYSNSKVDSYIDGAIMAWDKKQKNYLWKQFQSQVAKDIPCTFLFTQDILVSCAKNLKNVITDKRGYLVNVKEWWLDKNSTIIH